MASANGDLIDQFVAITGASKERAETMLEFCANNLEMAIDMHWESDAGSGSSSNVPAASSSSSIVPDLIEEEVRPPMEPTREVLVGPLMGGIGGFLPPIRRARPNIRGVPSVFTGGLRDFAAETRDQEERVSRGLSPLGASTSTDEAKTRRLEDLFRPPFDLIYGGPFQTARDAGAKDNKWLLVNIQNHQEFKCQILNRDVWTDKRVRALVKENFIFWQAYIDSEDGERFSMFYPVKDWPYIAVIDPRTGENLAQWHETDPNVIFQNLNDFLGDHSSTPGEAAANNAPPKKARVVEPLDDVSVVDLSEESQLEAAIKASLAETEKAAKKKQDDDADESESELETFSDSEASFSGFPSPYKKLASQDKTGASSSSSATAAVVNSKRNLAEAMDSKEAEDPDRWKKYLGDSGDPESKLLLRLPDGKKVHVNMPCSSRLQAVISYADCLGFPPSKFEIVTAFPRKNVSQMPSESTLKEAGLFPNETMFVQARSNA